MSTSETEKAPIHVLLVEDHSIVRAGLRMLIETQPEMKVVGEAGTRSEALELAAREQPDIILLDLMLGPDNGLDLISPLLGASEESHVIVLTGVSDFETHRRAMRLGAKGILLKEASTDYLLKAIERVHAGELWIDRKMTAHLFSDMRRSSNAARAETKADKISRLTDREREVISLVGEGLKNKQIADRLCISEITVRHHLTSIFEKVEVSDRLELLIYAYQNGLVALPRT